jgi:signal transduction histidine kinase
VNRVTKTEIDNDVAAIAGIDAVTTILEVVCRTTGMGFAAVARVTDDRWVACAVKDEIQFGLKPGGELKVETTICSEIRASGQAVVIDHVAEDEAFRGHPTPALYGFQSYISMPITRANGVFFGTLCAIDPRPMRLNTPETVGMFRLFADLIGFHLDGRDRLAVSEAALLNERETAELREQFIAVLGHDLRNPLASIDAGTRMLEKTPLDEKARAIVTLIQSSVWRMAGLIENVLDFARGRLGGGLTLNRSAAAPLAPVLLQVVEELQAAWPERDIRTHVDLPKRVNCDRARMAQLLSNLLGNALTHGAPDKPVLVGAALRDGRFELYVVNGGAPISEKMLERLFEPFSREPTGGHSQGLGLGLFIAAEIARAHGGTLTAKSVTEETRFTMTMPV